MAFLRHGFEETGDAQESRLRSPQQRICELLLKNQQPKWALSEFSTIAGVIKRTHQPKLWHDHPVVHDLSNKQEQQVRAGRSPRLIRFQAHSREIGEELGTLYREQQKVERDLSRIPSGEVLVPLTQGLTEARARAADANLLAAQKRAELADLAQSRRTLKQHAPSKSTRLHLRILNVPRWSAPRRSKPFWLNSRTHLSLRRSKM